MAKKAYIGVSVISNPGPFSNTNSWLANQNVIISVNNKALKVVSNQDSSTPGVYTILSKSIPANTQITLTYKLRGNVRVCGAFWGTDYGQSTLATPYYTLTEEVQTFTLTGQVKALTDRFYFFMASPTTSSWFEVVEIKLDYGVAKSIKKGYIGINGIARKIKKAYIGIGGIARPCWAGGTLTYYGKASTGLKEGLSYCNGTSVGNYAIFAGGKSSSGHSKIATAYNKTLTVSYPSDLSELRGFHAAASNANYAVFAGGNYNGYPSNTADGYNSSLTLKTVALPRRTAFLAGGSVGNYAVFGGGEYGERCWADVAGYDLSLTKVDGTAMSSKRTYGAATSVGNYVLFGGGYNMDNGAYLATVDCYNTSLTRSSTVSLGQQKRNLAAAKLGSYALFGGGLYSQSLSSVDAFNTSLTRTSVASLNSISSYLTATSIPDFAIFAGGQSTTLIATTTAYSTSLTKVSSTNLSEAKNNLGAASIGNYALFAGGSYASTYYKTVDVYTSI